MRRSVFVAGLLALGLAVAGSGLQAQDSSLDPVMKKVQPAVGALRKSIEAMDAAAAKEATATLSAAFTDAQAFFKKEGKTDGQEWAAEAGKVVASIQTAVAGSKWDEVKAQAGSLGKLCQTCHAKYREKSADGTFTYKPGN